MEKYIVKGGKKLRYGYTTGSCATAAAKAATIMLYLNKITKEVSIDTPKGWKLTLSVLDVEKTSDYVICAIKKDSGDDPDITNGIKVFARVEKNREASESIVVSGGEGVGTVTKPGLSVEVGQPAINPTPIKMIKESVSSVLPQGEKVKITIFVPEGEERAKKTFNEKLGIIGGISIIGTSGIVEPMSNEAMKSSLALELSMIKERGDKFVVFCPGNYGLKYAYSMGIDDKSIVKTSNFIGFMIEKAVEYGFESILIIGHIGKLIKVAGGIFDTHSRVSDARMEILAANCALLGANQDLIKRIMGSNTTEEAINYIYESNLCHVFDLISKKVSNRCEDKSRGVIRFESIIFSLERGILSKDLKDNLSGVKSNV